jgi:hypothetical protein
MRSLPHHPVLLSVLATTFIFGCKAPEKAADVRVASAPPIVLPSFEQEIPSFKATLTLPGAWKGGYRLVERADTMFGAFRAAEFHYTADSARGVPSRLLMVIRAFKKPAFEKVRAKQDNVSKVLAEHDGVVYTYSIVASSPYGPNSAATLRVDAMMVPLVSEANPLKLTFK